VRLLRWVHWHVGLGIRRPCPKRGAIEAHGWALPSAEREREREDEAEHGSNNPPILDPQCWVRVREL
jgi:hypothetical protein